MGLDYSLLPTASADPVPLVGSGKFYSKGPNGNVQAFYQDDAGNVYQLTPTTPATPTPNYQFIYDSGAVPSGNVYADFGAMLAAANALAGVKTIFMLTDTPDLATGNFDLSNCEFVTPLFFLTIRFTDDAVMTGFPARLNNVFIRYTPTVVDHVLFDVNAVGLAINCIFEGYSGLEVGGNPPAGSSGAMIRYVGENFLNLQDESAIIGPSSNAGATGWTMFQRVSLGLAEVYFAMATKRGILGNAPDALFDASTGEFRISGKGCLPALGDFSNGQLISYLRGSINDTTADADYNTISPSALTGNSNDLDLPGLIYARNVRIDSTGAFDITGFQTAVLGRQDVLDNLAPQVRHCWNVSGFALLLVHNSGLSTAENRILCPNNADLQVDPNGHFLLWYDVQTQRWRVR